MPIDFFFVGLDGKYMPPAFAGAEEFSRGGARRLVRAYCSIANPWKGGRLFSTLVVATADALEIARQIPARRFLRFIGGQLVGG